VQITRIRLAPAFSSARASTDSFSPHRGNINGLEKSKQTNEITSGNREAGHGMIRRGRSPSPLLIYRGIRCPRSGRAHCSLAPGSVSPILRQPTPPPSLPRPPSVYAFTRSSPASEWSQSGGRGWRRRSPSSVASPSPERPSRSYPPSAATSP
jgi:hypothetical protein